MFKKVWFIIALIAAVCLCGCDTVPGGETTAPVDTALPAITPPPDTTAPPETTVPVEAQPPYPLLPVVQADHIAITDTVPEYDTGSNESFVIGSEAENGYFKAAYVHTFADTSSSRMPFDGKVFWIPDDPNEKNRGNHFQCYVLEDGQLKQLQRKSFSESYTLLGETFLLELEYSLLGDQVLLNYIPSEPEAYIWDTSRGIHECLVYFGAIRYFASVDLETGKLTDVFSGFDPALFGETYELLHWSENGDLFVAGKENTLYCFDVSEKARITYTPDNPSYALPMKDWEAASDGIICCYNHYTPQSGKGFQMVLTNRLMKISYADASFSPILEDVEFSTALLSGGSYILHWNAAGMWCVNNLASGENYTLPDAKSIHTLTNSFVIYQDSNNAYCIYDAVDNEVVTLTLPNGWSFSSARLQESPDGRKFFVYNRDENDIFQLLVFNADTNTLIELQRTNLNGLKDDLGLLWSENNEIVIGQEGRRDFCVYDFSRE